MSKLIFHHSTVDDNSNREYMYKDNKGVGYITDYILSKEEMQSGAIVKQRIMKGRDYSKSVFNCAIDCHKMTITDNIQQNFVNCNFGTTIKPFYGVVNKITDEKDRKMSNTDMIDAMRYFSTMRNPCAEIKTENTNWNFKSSSEDDINWKDIKGSLSYAEPLALVTRKYRDYVDTDKYVVVNKQLWDKSQTVGIDSPNIVVAIEKRVFNIVINFSDWVDWAKEVKAASWPDSIKSDLSVILPTV